MKRFLTILLLIALLLPVFCITAFAAAPTVTYRVGSQTVNAPIPADRQIVLPEAPTSALGTRTFVGWATAGKLYAAGDTYTHTGNGDVAFEAVSVDLKTMTGAAVSLTGNTTLRFDGAIDKAGYQQLVTLVGASEITLGVLVGLYRQVGTAQTFTHTSTASSLRVRISQSFAFATDTHAFFSGRTDPVANADILEKHAGRAYLTVRINGTAHTYYAAYDRTAHARSVHGVSAFAFEDRDANTPQGRYTAAAMQVLRARLDRVVSVDQTTNVVCNEYSHNNIDFLTYCYYTSPYRVSEVRTDYPTGGKDTYVIVGKDGGDFHNISAYFMGGSYRQPTGNECKSDGYHIEVYNHTA